MEVLLHNLFLVTGEMNTQSGVSKEFLFFPFNIALAFERFIFKSDYFSKSFRACITFSTDEILASVAIMSYAYSKEVISFSPIFIPSI